MYKQCANTNVHNLGLGLDRNNLLYKCTQNWLCTSVHKTGLMYKCTQNWFTVQVYIKLVYGTHVLSDRHFDIKRVYIDRTLIRNVY